MTIVRFHYGSMNCGKSTAVLQKAYLLDAVGFSPMLVKPEVDTREPGVIRSRIGLERPCFLINEDNVDHLLSFDVTGVSRVTHIICDEAQFLTKPMVWSLACYADRYGIEVDCYGLRTSYTAELFPGSAALMAIADELIEIPSPSIGGGKAIMHLRRVDGELVFEGNPIHVGDVAVDYESVSRERYVMAKDGFV